MLEDNPQLVSRSAWKFLSGTFLSRLAGMFRDMAMAFCFGSSPSIAAFMVAFRFANLMRRLFGESALSSGFIPHFEEVRKGVPEKGAQYFRDLFFSLTCFLSGIILLVEGALFTWLKWGALSPDSAQIIEMTMWMLPGVLFICLFALSSALMQCERKFFLTGFAPVAFNLVWIGAVWYLKDWNHTQAIFGLSAAVVVAFFMQWLLIAPYSLRFVTRYLSFKEWTRPKLFSAEIKALFRPVLLSVIGIGAMQINSALDSIFARFASLEGPAYLWYAIRLQQLPLALFGIALSSALLPPLSRAMQANVLEQYHRLLHFALSRSFSFIFPCCIAIFVLGAASVNLVFGRGDFDQGATLNTVICLWGYGIGLVPAVFVLLLAPAFYAKKDFRTPTIAALLSVGFNTALNAWMVFGLHLGAFSIAVATSLASLFNFFYLSRKLSGAVGPLFNAPVLYSFSKTALCALIAGAVALAVGHYLVGDPTVSIILNHETAVFPRHFFDQALHFFVLAGTFGLIFFSYAWMFGAKDVLELIGIKKNA